MPPIQRDHRGVCGVGEVIDPPKRVRGISHRPVPDDFARHAGSEGDLRLKARYRVGRAVILRWRALTGIYCGAQRGPKRKGVSRSTATRPKPYKRVAMTESISWYDGDDDLASLGVGFDRSEW